MSEPLEIAYSEPNWDDVDKFAKELFGTKLTEAQKENLYFLINDKFPGFLIDTIEEALLEDREKETVIKPHYFISVIKSNSENEHFKTGIHLTTFLTPEEAKAFVARRKYTKGLEYKIDKLDIRDLYLLRLFNSSKKSAKSSKK